MNQEYYRERLFEFSNHYHNENEWVGNVKILQVGETCLDKGAEVEKHQQWCHEITYIISGNGVLEADGERYECSPGDIQVVSNHVDHYIVSNESSRLRYLHFAFDFDESKPHVLSDFYAKCKHLLIRDDGAIRTVLNMLVGEYFNESSFSHIAKDSLIQLVLVLIWRKVNHQQIPYQKIADRKTMGNKVYNMIKYIDTHVSEGLTVKRVAEEFFYSSNYASHLFKEKTGISLQEYIVSAKMKYAETMLKEGKMTLNEVVELTGYSSVQSFCKMFKKHTGHTPSDFKKEPPFQNKMNQ